LYTILGILIYLAERYKDNQFKFGLFCRRKGMDNSPYCGLRKMQTGNPDFKRGFFIGRQQNTKKLYIAV
jgi:predicted secreted protein